jgi:hypothetical protein
LLAALPIGCDNTARRESDALLAAVDQYRRAENPAKAERAQAVLAVACTAPDVCAARDACLAAINPTVRALTLKDEVAATLADIEAHRGSPDASDLPGKLDDAESSLKSGHAKMGGCEKALADLRLHHGG